MFGVRAFPCQHFFRMPVGSAGKRQVPLARLRISTRFLIEKTVILELKAVETLQPIHEAQLLTYLKLGGWPIGLLINFNVPILKKGIRRLVNNF